MILTAAMLAAFTTVASAAKPVHLFINLLETSVTTTTGEFTVHFTVSWNKIGAYKCVVGATVQYLGGYVPLGETIAYEGERVTSKSVEGQLTLVIPDTYFAAQHAFSGPLLVYAILYNRNGRSIEYAQTVVGDFSYNPPTRIR